VVSIGGDGEVLVGAPALARITTHPELTVAAFKRDMGTDRTYELGEHRFTPEGLSALVLSALKQDAEKALGAPVAGAVVTVPAYFDDTQRQAVRAAATIAGLELERIVNEPTAAAIAFGLHERDRELRAVVLDLGGGTFDVTVLEIVEGVIEIQSSAGDSRLGGEDFVDALAGMVAATLHEQYRVDVQRHRPGWARVREACETAKRHLSGAEQTRVALPQLPLAPGRTVDVEVPIDRERAEQLWAPLLGRLREPIFQALQDARLGPADIDEVIMVGGATRMPCVNRLAAHIFGRLPQRHLPPDEAVAIGASLLAAMQAGDEQVEELVVTDVAPFTLGIATVAELGVQRVNDVFSPILERGTVIPASRVASFSTVSNNQTFLRVEVFQGEHAHCSRNRKIGEYLLKGLPPGPAGKECVDVRFTYDLNGLIEVEMKVLSTGQVETLVIEESPGRLTAEQIEQAREQMRALKIHPREALPNATALERADALYQRLSGEPRAWLGQLIVQLDAALDSQDQDRITGARSELLAFVAGQTRQAPEP
jgi:molecular chaperone HscC